MGKKRNLPAELAEGFEALAAHRTGKATLPTQSVTFRPALKITPKKITKMRKSMNLCRGLFASCLRTSARTLENWEQGRATPNAQAALLIRLLQQYPDTIGRLNRL